MFQPNRWVCSSRSPGFVFFGGQVSPGCVARIGPAEFRSPRHLRHASRVFFFCICVFGGLQLRVHDNAVQCVKTDFFFVAWRGELPDRFPEMVIRWFRFGPITLVPSSTYTAVLQAPSSINASIVNHVRINPSKSDMGNNVFSAGFGWNRNQLVGRFLFQTLPPLLAFGWNPKHDFHTWL